MPASAEYPVAQCGCRPPMGVRVHEDEHQAASAIPASEPGDAGDDEVTERWRTTTRSSTT